MMRFLAVSASVLLAGAVSAQPAPVRRSPLTSVDGLRPHNVVVAPVTHAGKRGVRVTTAPEVLAIAQQQKVEQLAVIDGTDFTNGTIEVELSGVPAPDAPAGARGFVGIAFRVQPDRQTYDAFYLRPTNGRADDQLRRNHSAQYISHPDWPWNRLRTETPSKYEAYVDLVPDAWTRVRIEVRGDTARLFVHGQPQPTLIVGDVKTGATARGAVALWIDTGTIAYFRDLRVTTSR